MKCRTEQFSKEVLPHGRWAVSVLSEEGVGRRRAEGFEFEWKPESSTVLEFPPDWRHLDGFRVQMETLCYFIMPVTTRVEVAPELLEWARERSGRDKEYFDKKFPKLPEWIAGTTKPTFKQLEDYANSTYTAIGYFFLSSPPEEKLPMPDYRILRNKAKTKPSPHLRDTIYLCQERQDWYQDYARTVGLEPVEIVGMATLTEDAASAAASLQQILKFGLNERKKTWENAFNTLKVKIQDLGVLVMTSSIVGNNTHRKLDYKEFRGFTLIDSLAPLIFVNGSDTKAAQMFTLAHELAHIVLGEPGLDSVDMSSKNDKRIENWCNSFAAEFLLPINELKKQFRMASDINSELKRLASKNKVSTLVVLRRIYDAGYLEWNEYQIKYKKELARLLKLFADKNLRGGNYYQSLLSRVGKNFSQAVIHSTLGGDTLYREAYDLLGIKKHSAFQRCAAELGIS